jgi:hypothetical protein
MGECGGTQRRVCPWPVDRVGRVQTGSHLNARLPSSVASPSGDRDLLEVFGSGDVDERSVPAEFEHGVLVAFAVEDVVSAREELAMAGIEIIGELLWAADVTGDPADQGWGWCFFRAPDNNVYVLQQDGVGRNT